MVSPTFSIAEQPAPPVPPAPPRPLDPPGAPWPPVSLLHPQAGASAAETTAAVSPDMTTTVLLMRRRYCAPPPESSGRRRQKKEPGAALEERPGPLLRSSNCPSPFPHLGQAFALPLPSSLPIVILRGWTSGFLGTTTCRTPFFSSALTFSPSVPSGSVNARLKLPYERSLA
jgi:hypothetical protein